MLRHIIPGTVLASILLLAGGVVQAQNVTLDEGTFIISMDGQRVGTETFTIRRAGTGENTRIIATARIRLDLSGGALNLDPALEAAGSPLSIAAYQVKVSGIEAEEIAMSLADRRFVARIRSARGEQVREFRASPSTLILDEGVAHQYYFLHYRVDAGAEPIHALQPRTGGQARLSVEVRGRETLNVGGEQVSARHLVLQGNGDTRHIWLDEDGRVLRVVLDGGAYRAERQDPPS